MDTENGKKWLRRILALLGLVIGLSLAQGLNDFLVYTGYSFSFNISVVLYAGIALLFGFIFYFIAPLLAGLWTKMLRAVEKRLTSMPMSDIVFGIIGLLVGLLLSFLLSMLYQLLPIPMLPTILTVITYLGLCYIGITLATKRQQELPFSNLFRNPRSNIIPKAKTATAPIAGSVKVLDTSSIIDGRIYDVIKTGFLEGPLMVSEFVLTELRHIADSSDSQKRARGRRGLDILMRIQKELPIEVIITDQDYEEGLEVDVKLLKLAQDMGGSVVTNDYNLNKVAEVAGVRVLNINDLSNAVKPIVLPNEEMKVHILREGKEPGQGVAYLSDGTMIVVENGKRYVGDDMDVVVTSVLQTSAGRMIFTRIK